MENKLIPGLVSVTFRGMKPEEIIETAKKSGLKTIEWGSDVHVPAGDTKAAENVKRLSDDNGILVASYGSYHGKGESGLFKFADSIRTAEQIGAKNIRIWQRTQRNLRHRKGLIISPTQGFLPIWRLKKI